MFKKIKFSKNKIYPTLVVSTMSSGKSTLINAIVGQELLPSRNCACTAKAVAILDNDMKEEFEIHAVDSQGKYSIIPKATKKSVEHFNDTNEVQEMILEGQISGIKNSRKSLFIIDTPGINNNMDLTHEFITKSVLEEYSEGLILYVINAQQIGTYDDSSFLTFIANKLKGNSKFKIIFVVNKMDLIDFQHEEPGKLIQNCRKYVESKGINNPILIPVSASSALIFKKILRGDVLSEIEEENFVRNYRHFKNTSFSLVNYANIPDWGELEEKIEIDGHFYTRGEIRSALNNTGITQLESIIDETMVYSLKMKAPKITCTGKV